MAHKRCFRNMQVCVPKRAATPTNTHPPHEGRHCETAGDNWRQGPLISLTGEDFFWNLCVQGEGPCIFASLDVLFCYSFRILPSTVPVVWWRPARLDLQEFFSVLPFRISTCFAISMPVCDTPRMLSIPAKASPPNDTCLHMGPLLFHTVAFVEAP